MSVCPKCGGEKLTKQSDHCRGCNGSLPLKQSRRTPDVTSTFDRDTHDRFTPSMPVVKWLEREIPQ